MYDFLQKNNKFVKIVTQIFPWPVKPVRMTFDTFVKVPWCPVYTNPFCFFFWGGGGGGIPLKHHNGPQSASFDFVLTQK